MCRISDRQVPIIASHKGRTEVRKEMLGRVKVLEVGEYYMFNSELNDMRKIICLKKSEVSV